MLFIGLIFDVVLIILVVVSIMLIYSLLLVSVETRTFEIGVMRLVGLTKCGIVTMILTQAMMFVLPAVILGFSLAFPIIYVIFKHVYSDNIHYMPPLVPSGWAIFRALFIGILIPLLSSIVPI